MKLLEKLAYDLANGPAPDEASFQLMQLAYKEGFRKAREMAFYLCEDNSFENGAALATKVYTLGEEDAEQEPEENWEHA